MHQWQPVMATFEHASLCQTSEAKWRALSGAAMQVPELSWVKKISNKSSSMSGRRPIELFHNQWGYAYTVACLLIVRKKAAGLSALPRSWARGSAKSQPGPAPACLWSAPCLPWRQARSACLPGWLAPWLGTNKALLRPSSWPL